MRVKRLSWIAALLFLGVLGLRTFVGDVFRVTSSSMAPSIWPGEIVWVAYDRSRPARLEPVVVDIDDEYVVKRAAGIGGRGGEDILIDSKGDLRIDGDYIAPAVIRPKVLLFDSNQHELSKVFARGSSKGDPWSEGEGGVLKLDAREIPRGARAGLMRYHPRLLDNYLDATGVLIQGDQTVHDALLSCQVRSLEPGGVLRVDLLEEGDTFSLIVELDAEEPRMRIERLGKKLEVLAECALSCEVEQWMTVSLTNVDNHLTAQVGSDVLTASYERNFPIVIPGSEDVAPGTSLGDRVRLGGEECLIELRDVRLWRDVHYTSRGEFAVGMRHALESGQLFLLGDNSAHSQDSREYGPIEESQLVGRPVMVVWPPSAWRFLD